jgi:hypothetical protein
MRIRTGTVEVFSSLLHLTPPSLILFVLSVSDG